MALQEYAGASDHMRQTIERDHGGPVRDGVTSAFLADVKAYAAREFTRKSLVGVREGAEIVELILRDGGYRKVLEIGTYRGVSAALMARIVESVTTIDLIDGKMERDRQIFDRVKLWEALRVPNIMLHLVKSDLEKAHVISKLQFDFAFVDGDHEGSAPRKDFNLVKHCGAVLFHDYGADNGVTDLVRSLPRRQVKVFDIFAFWRDI